VTVSIMRSKPRKRKSTIWLGSETIRGGPHHFSKESWGPSQAWDPTL